MKVKTIFKVLLGSFLLFQFTESFPHTAYPPQAAIASASPLATQAGLDILAAGGNAFDAAVAVASVLGVAEPFNSGLGAGAFWLIYRASHHKYEFIDSREVAPLRAKASLYRTPESSLNGPLAAAIPGEVAGMVYLATHEGRLPLSVTLQPAIRLAEKGILVNALYQRAAKDRLPVLRQYKETAQGFLTPEGEVPPLNTRIIQPALARTLKNIAKYGNKGFYEGPMALQLVKGVQKAGGIWQLQDLKTYHVILRKPLISHYGNARLILAPLPSAGGVGLIEMLNILSQVNLFSMTPVERIHFVVEAMRRAYAHRLLLGDPAFVTPPLEKLLSPSYGKEEANSILPHEASANDSLKVKELMEKEGRNTTHFSILDKEGNRVAATLTLNNWFGSGFIPSGTGVLLNDGMDDFSTASPNLFGLSPSAANKIEPGKRPLSSMSPTMMEWSHKVAILGTPGGSRIVTMTLLAILDAMADHGPLSWVSLPRYHHQFEPDVISYEKGAFTQKEKETLLKWHYVLEERDVPYGNMQAILWDQEKNKVFAASDPRGAGRAGVR